MALVHYLKHGDHGRDSLSNSPVSFFLIFQKAIRNELDELHQMAMAHLSGQQNADMNINLLVEKYQFLWLIYKHHLDAKNEVIFAALDSRVKNLAHAYLLQHKDEKDVFDQLLMLLNSETLQNEVSFQREFVSLTGVLQMLIAKNMAKEEEQVFPVLQENFTLEEQASLVWQFLCSMPTYVLAKTLSWLSACLSNCEHHSLLECLGKIVPEEKLLQQAIFNWIGGKDSHDMKLISPMAKENCESEHTGSHPIDDMLLWHKAIKRDLKETFERIKTTYLAGDFTAQSAFEERLRFLVEICIFHSFAKDKIVFPAVYLGTSSFNQRAEVESKFNEFWTLIQSARTVSITPAEFHLKLFSCADQIIETLNRQFYIDEVQVLPLARVNLKVEKQRVILYQSLCMMPLKLIEQALPWLIGTMNDEEMKKFLNNLQLAAPASDTGLVDLFCSWACKIGKQDLYSSSSAKGVCPTIRSFHVDEEFKSNGHKLQFDHHSFSFPGLGMTNNNFKETYDGFSAEQPIDVIFKVHKAIRRDLEYLSVESGRVRDGDEAFLHQFIGRFCLLWGLYKAHSNSEDNIIHPALESREALRNVTRSYILDHKQEERIFEDISCVLSQLSQIHGVTKCVHIKKDSSTRTSELSSSSHSDCVTKYSELSTKLQVMCKSIRVMIGLHISREEHELWPLFGSHFSVEEQNKIVGFVLGTTGAEMLQLFLPWVTSALTQDEKDKMMETLKQVTRNTMFSDWLNEWWKGASGSLKEPNTPETNVSPKGSMGQSDRMFMPRDIKTVYLDSTSGQKRRANRLQSYMAGHWTAAQQRLTQAGENLIGETPSFCDPEGNVFGCEHYKRNCKLRAACCGKLFTCCFCHDKTSDHPMDRKSTMEMMCMRCLNMQPIGPKCTTPSCKGLPMAKYYCSICKLFEDERNVYHCPFCNICRIGKGLGIDYFHCMTCNCCLSIRLLSHKCKENCLEPSCLLCDEFLFTSTTPVRALPCGHFIHSTCYKACEPSPYRCLVCNQSSGDRMKSAETSVLVIDDGEMKMYNQTKRGTTKTSSWTDENLEKHAFSFARFLAKIFSPLLLRFGRGRIQRVGKVIQNVVEGNTGKDTFLLCCFVLGSLLVFCAVSSLIVLLSLKLVRGGKFIAPW